MPFVFSCCVGPSRPSRLLKLVFFSYIFQLVFNINAIICDDTFSYIYRCCAINSLMGYII